MIGNRLQEMLRKWSPTWRPLGFKATLIAILASAIVVPLLFLAIPYLEIFNDMAVQPKGKSQSLYGWFSDEARIVERLPVEGTLPMNWYPYAIEGVDEDAAKRAGETLVNDLAPTVANQKRGQKIFNVYCIVCHGEHAKGDGRIVGPEKFPAPPSLHTETAQAFPDGRIFHVITRGQNKMPSYADVLDPDERWAVVLYVRALQRAMQMNTEEGNR